LLVIEAQQEDGPATYWGQGYDRSAIEFEMHGPLGRARIEQRYEVTCLRVTRSYVRSLIAIAAETGIGEVLQHSCPTMLLPDNVIRLMRGEHDVFGNTAVFAAVPGTSGNSAPESGG
jgi:hypothetical protein